MRPSGDQRGVPASPVVVKRVALLPSARDTWMSLAKVVLSARANASSKWSAPGPAESLHAIPNPAMKTRARGIAYRFAIIDTTFLVEKGFWRL